MTLIEQLVFIALGGVVCLAHYLAAVASLLHPALYGPVATVLTVAAFAGILVYIYDPKPDREQSSSGLNQLILRLKSFISASSIGVAFVFGLAWYFGRWNSQMNGNMLFSRHFALGALMGSIVSYGLVLGGAIIYAVVGWFRGKIGPKDNK